MGSPKANKDMASADSEAVALLERRLACSTLFAKEQPYLQTVPTTSNPGLWAGRSWEVRL